jgi:hypothetical protein
MCRAPPHAPAHAWDVRHEWPQKLHGVFRPDRPVAFAEHVGDEDDVTLGREHLTGFDGRLDAPRQLGAMSNSGRDALTPSSQISAPRQLMPDTE